MSTTASVNPPTYAYPRVEYNGTTQEHVYFKQAGEGMVIASPDPARLGVYSSSFTMASFEPMTDSITLSNVPE
jgi:hypothetical protein